MLNLRNTLCALSLGIIIGCGADKSQVKSEAGPDIPIVKGFNFIESALYAPVGGKKIVAKEHISAVKMSEAMALKAFPSVQSAKDAMLKPFGEGVKFDHIRLFLFDQFNEGHHGGKKRLPTFWVVLPEGGSVITEDHETWPTDQFLLTLQEELSMRTNAEEISNLKKQIEFLRAIP